MLKEFFRFLIFVLILLETEYAVFVYAADTKGGKILNVSKNSAEDIVSEPINIDNADITLSTVSYVYSGKACQPEVKIICNNTALISGTDYTVSYQNNINAGTAFVIITGNGNYTGGVKKTFSIVRREASSVKISPVPLQIYTGKKVKPSLKLTYAGKALIKGTDYTMTYTNHVKPGKGTAKVKVDFKGNFSGSRSVRFSILPGKPVLKTSVSASAVRLEWNKVSRAGGYRIYRRKQKDSSWVYLGETAKLTCTDKNRKQNTSYTYAVRAFVKINGKRFYSEYQKKTVKTKKTSALFSSRVTETTALRKSPSTSGKKIKKLSKGSTVKVVRGYQKRKNGYTWYKVKNGKGYGYISAKSTEKTEKYAVKSNVEFQIHPVGVQPSIKRSIVLKRKDRRYPLFYGIVKQTLCSVITRTGDIFRPVQ